MRAILLTTMLLCGISTSTFAQLQSAEDFLGYALGEQFTPHHRLVEYVKHVSENSPNAQHYTYGYTYEGREQVVLYISSAENLKNLENIRNAHTHKIGLNETAATAPEKTIVWMNYNIHGDEASASEAGLATINDLVYNPEKKVQNWLNDMIIIIEPCVNPDGRDRFVTWYKQERNATANPDLNAQEHHHPWASGRQNHYLIDLNRDWAWHTQQETKNRLALYQQWMPHVHCDFHEMGHDEDYFFAPAARPFHNAITEWQRQFQNHVGRNHVQQFDQEGWLYYTGADFDLFYPSYGDTWPIFNGAMGFTYEQGGSRRAGTAVNRENGQVLTLKERVDHHKVISISTIEASFNYSAQLQEEFIKYFEDGNNNSDGEYGAYIIKNNNDRTTLAIAQYLDRQQIQYGHPKTTGKTAKGWSYRQVGDGSTKLEDKDLIIPANQPLSKLIRVLFEPNPELEDSSTYDATAWAIPYMFNVEAYAVKNTFETTPAILALQERPLKFSAVPYAWIQRWDDPSDVEFLSQLLQHDIHVRTLNGKVQMGSEKFGQGSIVILKADNVHLTEEELLDRFNQVVAMTKQVPLAVNTGFTNAGQDLGHYSVTYLHAPKVALLSGGNISSTDFGEVWFYFDQQLKYPVSVIRMDYIESVDLSAYDVVIAPSGYYGSATATLLDYASNGGKLIAMGRTVNGLARMASGEDGPSPTALAQAVAKAASDDKKPSTAPLDYGGQGRRYLSNSTAGSIFKVQLDVTHPLAFGVGPHFFMLKTNSRPFPFLANGQGWNVGRLTAESYVSGFVGANLKPKLTTGMAIGIESYGGGDIIYFTDSPIFRDFWYGGTLLFANAIFQVN